MAASSGVNGESLPKCARIESLNKVTVVIGAQWGDEGKGKLVDMLAQTADVVCRCQVGRKFDGTTLRLPAKAVTSRGGRPCHVTCHR